MNKNKTEKLIHDIFTLCDKTVWLEDFPRFQDAFEKILKKSGYNLWKIYFGVPSKKAWRSKCKKAYMKYLKASRKEDKSKNDPNHVYIKNRRYKIK